MPSADMLLSKASELQPCLLVQLHLWVLHCRPLCFISALMHSTDHQSSVHAFSSYAGVQRGIKQNIQYTLTLHIPLLHLSIDAQH